MIRCLGFLVYVVWSREIEDGTSGASRLATAADVADPELAVGCLVDGRTIPLSDYERKHRTTKDRT